MLLGATIHLLLCIFIIAYYALGCAKKKDSTRKSGSNTNATKSRVLVQLPSERNDEWQKQKSQENPRSQECGPPTNTTMGKSAACPPTTQTQSAAAPNMAEKWGLDKPKSQSMQKTNLESEEQPA